MHAQALASTRKSLALIVVVFVAAGVSGVAPSTLVNIRSCSALVSGTKTLDTVTDRHFIGDMHGRTCSSSGCCWLMNGVRNTIDVRDASGVKVASTDALKLLKDVSPFITGVGKLADRNDAKQGRLLEGLYQTCAAVDYSSVFQVTIDEAAHRLRVCSDLGLFARRGGRSSSGRGSGSSSGSQADKPPYFPNAKADACGPMARRYLVLGESCVMLGQQRCPCVSPCTAGVGGTTLFAQARAPVGGVQHMCNLTF